MKHTECWEFERRTSKYKNNNETRNTLYTGLKQAIDQWYYCNIILAYIRVSFYRRFVFCDHNMKLRKRTQACPKWMKKMTSTWNEKRYYTLKIVSMSLCLRARFDYFASFLDRSVTKQIPTKYFRHAKKTRTKQKWCINRTAERTYAKRTKKNNWSLTDKNIWTVDHLNRQIGTHKDNDNKRTT